jgi:anti-anti-sigma factor
VAEIERVMVDEGIVAVIVKGEYDLADEARSDLAVDFVVGLEIPGVLIDLSACEFIDAAALRMLLHAKQRIARTGAIVAFASPPSQARRMMDLTGLSHQLDLFDTRDAAFAALRNRVAQPQPLP